jgi:hypothetical protein
VDHLNQLWAAGDASWIARPPVPPHD